MANVIKLAELVHKQTHVNVVSIPTAPNKMLWGIFANFMQQEMNQWMECANESKRMYGVKCAEAVFHFFLYFKQHNDGTTTA